MMILSFDDSFKSSPKWNEARSRAISLMYKSVGLTWPNKNFVPRGNFPPPLKPPKILGGWDEADQNTFLVEPTIAMHWSQQLFMLQSVTTLHYGGNHIYSTIADAFNEMSFLPVGVWLDHPGERFNLFCTGFTFYKKSTLEAFIWHCLELFA